MGPRAASRCACGPHGRRVPGRGLPGARLLALAEAGSGHFELPTIDDGPPSKVRVAAQIGRYGLGAHATADELTAITTDVGAKEVMLVHGEPRGQEIFRSRLALRGQGTVLTGGWRG